MRDASMQVHAQEAVTFWVWPTLSYKPRMGLSFALITVGFLLQWWTLAFVWGLPFLLAGNALLLARGYDNQLDLEAFSPDRHWQRVERVRLIQLKNLDKKMQRWDRSWLDITNLAGAMSFFALSFVLGWLYVAFAKDYDTQALTILPLDMAVLFLPHWFTGTRRLMRLPKLVKKVEVLDKALRQARPEERGDRVEVLMLLRGDEQKLPEDVKIKVTPENAPDWFLGLYGQVVINEVQGQIYPYFYVVLVAQPNKGLKTLEKRFEARGGLISEFKRQSGVEVMIIRQRTTKDSGYHTPSKKVGLIFQQGLRCMHALLEDSGYAAQ